MRNFLICITWLAFYFTFWQSGSAQFIDWGINLEAVSGTSEIRGISANANGDVFATGKFTGTVDFDPGPGVSSLTAGAGGASFICRFDSSGNFLSVRNLNSGGGIVQVYHLASDSAHNLYLTGIYTGSPDFDPSPAVMSITSTLSSYDIFVLKLDSTGNSVWAWGVGGSDEEYPVHLAISGTGSVYLSGTFKGTVDFDPGPGVSSWTASLTDCFLLKLAASGIFETGFGWGTPSNSDKTGGIAVHPSGSISAAFRYTYASGWLFDIDPGFGVYTINSGGNEDAFILNLDSSLNFISAYKFLSSNTEAIYDICYGESGNLIMAGNGSYTTDFDPGPGTEIFALAFSEVDFFSELNPAGGLEWVSFLNPADGFSAVANEFRFILDPAENIYAPLNFYGTVDFDPGAGLYPMTGPLGLYSSLGVLKLDPNGEMVWAKQINGADTKNIKSCVISEQGKILLSGWFRGTVDADPGYGSFTINAGSIEDGFLIQWPQDGCFPFALTIDSIHPPLCSSGTGYVAAHAMNGTLPYAYNWNTIPPTPDSAATITSPGIYTLTVVDSLGCSIDKSVLISASSYPSGFDLRANPVTGCLVASAPSLLTLDVFNDGCVPVSGSVRLILHPDVIYNTALPLPASISGDTLTWNFSMITFDSLHINPKVWVSVAPGVTPGTLVPFEVYAAPVALDANTSNNYRVDYFEVKSSYDPNDKKVYPPGICNLNYVLSDEPLTYTVRFQNTGTAEALNVFILDSLDSDLERSTLHILASSHPMWTEIMPDLNTVNFHFDDIHLPDSSTDEPGSHGYVMFEVWPDSGVANGTEVFNSVAIYFDFNPPVITNETFNTLLDVLPEPIAVFDTTEVCYGDSFVFADGTVASGILDTVSHTSEFLTWDGCDSTITQLVQVVEIDTAVIDGGTVFYAAAAGLAYQWIFCATGLPVPGANAQSFSPPADSAVVTYAVIIYDGACSDTSRCIDYIVVSTEGPEILYSLGRVWPNPADDECWVKVSGGFDDIYMVSLTGVRMPVQIAGRNSEDCLLDTRNIPDGMYILVAHSSSGFTRIPVSIAH